MDARVRLRLRQWQSSGDPNDQAFAMAEAIRYGALDPKMVQLAAFLGHPASRLIGEDVRPGGVVIKGVLARNGDMRELALGLSYFGRPAVLRINLALVRMAFATRLSRQIRTGRAVYINERYYQTFSRTGPNPTWLLIRNFRQGATGQVETPGVPVYEWFHHAEQATNGNKDSAKILRAYSADRNYTMGNAGYYFRHPYPLGVLNLAHEALCSERARPKVLKFCNGQYDDETMLKYMKAEVLPWALGEFSEESAPPEFVAYPPFAPK